MKQKIKEAIETTLVVDNKQSIDLCVNKIINSIQEQKKSDAVDFHIFDNINNRKFISEMNDILNEYSNKNYEPFLIKVKRVYEQFLYNNQ